MKTTHRVAATLLLTVRPPVAPLTHADDSPAENVTTDTNDEDDGSEDTAARPGIGAK